MFLFKNKSVLTTYYAVDMPVYVQAKQELETESRCKRLFTHVTLELITTLLFPMFMYTVHIMRLYFAQFALIFALHNISLTAEDLHGQLKSLYAISSCTV